MLVMGINLGGGGGVRVRRAGLLPKVPKDPQKLGLVRAGEMRLLRAVRAPSLRSVGVVRGASGLGLQRRSARHVLRRLSRVAGNRNLQMAVGLAVVRAGRRRSVVAVGGVVVVVVRVVGAALAASPVVDRAGSDF